MTSTKTETFNLITLCVKAVLNVLLCIFLCPLLSIYYLYKWYERRCRTQEARRENPVAETSELDVLPTSNAPLSASTAITAPLPTLAALDRVRVHGIVSHDSTGRI
ncbi:hypothetical protein SBOR_7661 [Sclerotinia borealis F-4128]|uniref:Uncharacterized protein n=1 Tax=Sclerotinia borealis (strain F-4128) TaxID=1432307 RepID=W9C5C4_SCLBF|nr:hypothetical protein SBOR_7661 [Sclerotinia borealis F-4128]